jgi:hypothetical protein
MVKIDVIQGTLRRMANELLENGIAIPGAKSTLLKPPSNPEITESMLPEQQYYIAKAENNTYWLTDIVNKHKDNPAYTVCISIGQVKHNAHVLHRTLCPVYGTTSFCVYWVLKGTHCCQNGHYTLPQIVQG